MARIIVGSYMFRFPLGGMLSWVLQYLLGLQRLGHDVFFVEKYGYDNACFDPQQKKLSDDCSCGIRRVSALLHQYGLGEKWCFVEKGDRYYGLSRQAINDVFSGADLFIDMGTHGSWQEEAQHAARCVWIDGEPGYTQIKLAHRLQQGGSLPVFDQYFSNGINIGQNDHPVPTLGIQWVPLFHPVDMSVFSYAAPRKESAFTTVMNWQSHAPIVFNGKTYGQKDIEFEKFKQLPVMSSQRMEVAVTGQQAPLQELATLGWQVTSGLEATQTFHSFREYIRHAKGEFSVCKNIFVDMQTGWFSDKSAAFLASGRPVILQDTGFAQHLPTGLGLFAVTSAEQAVHAMEVIHSAYEKNCRAARELAAAYFDNKKVMKRFLELAGAVTPVVPV